jgi:hypothetical protein
LSKRGFDSIISKVLNTKKGEAMETVTIVTYVVCDDVIKSLGIKDDIQVKMNTAEVMTTAIISAVQYFCNLEKARKALKSDRYIPNMLSKSQLNRRLHKIENRLWIGIMKRLFSEFLKHNCEKQFVVDSFPVPACKLARKNRSKIYSEKKYLGYCAAKQEYYVGFKLHMITDVNGNPIDFVMLPASGSDIASFRSMDINLPPNAVIYADKAYNDYKYEDYLVGKKQIHLLPIRKKNSKRKGSPFLEKIRKKKRRIIESAFSCIEKLMPRSIHAVTKAGFELKALLFVLAYAFNRYAVPPSEASFETPTTSALRTSGIGA